MIVTSTTGISIDVSQITMADIAGLCDMIVAALQEQNTPPNIQKPRIRERAVVITKLQEVRMWAEEAQKP